MGSKCISLYNDETDELICRSCPVYGTVKGMPAVRAACTAGHAVYAVVKACSARIASQLRDSQDVFLACASPRAQPVAPPCWARDKQMRSNLQVCEEQLQV